MSIATPPPRTVPPELLKSPSGEFFKRLNESVFTQWFNLGGKEGKQIVTATGTPTIDPGWTASSTSNMTPPDGYIKLNNGGQDVVVPYWNA